MRSRARLRALAAASPDASRAAPTPRTAGTCRESAKGAQQRTAAAPGTGRITPAAAPVEGGPRPPVLVTRVGLAIRARRPKASVPFTKGGGSPCHCRVQGPPIIVKVEKVLGTITPFTERAGASAKAAACTARRYADFRESSHT